MKELRIFGGPAAAAAAAAAASLWITTGRFNVCCGNKQSMTLVLHKEPRVRPRIGDVQQEAYLLQETRHVSTNVIFSVLVNFVVIGRPAPRHLM